MAKGTNVNYDEVAKACSELFAEGQPTSFPRVYERIGKQGSSAIVTSYIKRWRAEMAEKYGTNRSVPDLPAWLVEASDKLLAGLWKQAVAEADEAYNDRVEALATEREHWSQRIDDAETATAEADRALLQAQGEIKALQVQLEARDTTIADLQMRNVAAAGLLAEKDKQLLEQRETLARLNATLEAERKQHTQDLAAERERHDQALATERERHDTEIANLRQKHQADRERDAEVAKGERQHLFEQTDTLRRELTALTTRFAKQTESTDAMVIELRKAASNARESAAAERARAQLLQQQLASAQNELTLLHRKFEARAKKDSQE